MIRRTDANHKQILQLLKRIPNLSVFSTHILGKGFPDIVIGYKGINYLVEIKDGNKVKSQKKLTEAETKFHEQWKGQIMIAENIDEILKILI